MRTAKGIIVIVVVLMLAMAGTAAADVPRLMSFQGKLTNTADQPLTGNYNFTFRLYGAATGGAATWTEVQNAVAVETGIYNVLLGSVTPLNLAFDTGYWLSVEVGADGEMSPRYRLTSAPYALYSDTATNVVSGGSGIQRIVLTGVFDTSALGDYIETYMTDSSGAIGRVHYKVVEDSRITLADLPNIMLHVENARRILYTSDGNVNVYDKNSGASFDMRIAEGKIYLAYRTQLKTHSYDALWSTELYWVLNGARFWIVMVK